MRQVWIVRSGAVELVDAGQVLDRLGEGELFGHPSMVSGLPTGFEARADDGALCYRLPAESVAPLLAQPAGLRYLARSLLSRPRPDAAAPSLARDPARQPVGRLVHERPVVCEPDDTVRDAARRMAAAGESAALVEDGRGQVRDPHRPRPARAGGRRRRLRGCPAGAGDERSGVLRRAGALRGRGDARDAGRGIRHVPVVSPFGEPLGVLTDVDLLATETLAPFSLRREIDEAVGEVELGRAAARLRPAVIALHDALVPAAQISGIIAIVLDALTRRLIELAIAELGPTPTPLSWIALGSLGRREIVPSSDVDSALGLGGRRRRRGGDALHERARGQGEPGSRASGLRRRPARRHRIAADRSRARSPAGVESCARRSSGRRRTRA